VRSAGLEKMWTVDELAEFAGVSVATLYHWRWEGKGPKAIKVGRFLRYPESDIEKWLDELGREVA
jgi:excisionase family DNA binding protein